MDVDVVVIIEEEGVLVLVVVVTTGEKSFSLYRIETPYPFTASVPVCRVASSTVNAEPSVTMVVIWLVKTEAHAWPMKLNIVGV